MDNQQALNNKIDSPSLETHFKRRLQEGVLILVSAVSLFLFLALITYHKADPGWSSTGFSQHIANAGGRAGAWFADLFLYLFGYLAYLLPFMLAYYAWMFFRTKPEKISFDWRVFALQASGFILIFAAGCALASLQLPFLHAHIPLSAGGIVGNLIGPGIAISFNITGATLLLLASFCVGITLFTGLSWLWLMDVTGRLLLATINYLVRLPQICVKFLFELAKKRAAQTKKSIPLGPQPILQQPSQQITLTTSKELYHPIIEETKPKKRSLKERKKSVFKPTSVGNMPSLNLLDAAEAKVSNSYSNAKLEKMSREVEAKLKDFNIEVQVVAVHPGPVITRFEMQLAPGIKVSRISTLAKDLARSLSVISVRIVEVIPGKTVVGLELPNEQRQMVRLSEILSSKQYEQTKSTLTLALGNDIAGHPVIVDLAKMPHLLVAGTTGSGKSVGINAMIIGLLYKSRPEDVRMIMVDPKMLELSIYEGIPHLLTPVVTDMKEAANALRWCVAEMERRYRLMAALGVRNLASFNHKIKVAIKNGKPIADPLWQPQHNEEECPTLEPIPYIVVIIDEYADMMMIVGKKVEQLIARIAQKARAAGIHLILATQRPSVDVITGLIKANVPTRIAFQVSSKIDSRTVIDQGGAEQLLGHGDMLYLPPGTSVPVRVHGAFVADDEVHKVVEDWRNRAEPQYIEGILNVSGDDNGAAEGTSGSESNSEQDPLYDEAVYFVTKSRRASISSVQRRLKIGYNRAARMIEDMENASIVSAMESNGSRTVLAPPPPED